MPLFKTHNDVTRAHRVAEAVGLTPDRQIQREILTGVSMEKAVKRCLHCKGELECRLWLEAHSDGADTPPSYCRNHAHFSALQPAPLG